MTVFKKNYHIDLSDVDFTKRLKLSSLFSHFQDVASLAAADLGFGIDLLEEKYDLAWILMKIRVDILRNPELDEEVIIETWPQEPKKIEFERDYIVRDIEGNPIVRAVSTWVIMDLKERKLRRSNTVPIQYQAVNPERALDVKLGKIKGFDNLEEAYQKVIGYSDVDFNGHLNNSRYVDYIMDCFDIEEHKNYEVKSIEVHFSKEALPGETLSLQKDISQSETGQVYIEGQNEDGKTVFKAKVEIAKRI
ncbi:acyl-[acyl-carrier-protein] thioesterase [Ornithinibacillus halophilus]|uniref:Acyl-ACP thioesterase n=1 Tax=Ornithinibacillus halophilus TaxID=930117 RepID=A0A1M5K475_9BACI|nr:acyl-ACP thioesterase domain-containing protein [Ornithinibacillus halophilus]SHG47555.1 Acyl-ACP thioesterase [Ornithinibacillus halophilus]